MNDMNQDSAVPVIAIDGPSASGKGSVAARVADALGYHYLDSGSLYRLVGLAARLAGVGMDNEAALAAIAQKLPARFEGGLVFLDNQDVTLAIRTEEASQDASRVAAWPAVREALLARQQAYREVPGLVAEGRDMATVVFPDARVKIFLTASCEARAERRYKQLMEKGLSANMADLLQDIQIRDQRDRERTVAPLVCAKDAVEIDTTPLTLAQSVAAVLELVDRAEL